MEFKQAKSQDEERILKDVVKQYHSEDIGDSSRELIKQLNLDCQAASGTYSDQVKKRLKRNLTPEEEDALDFYYLMICRESPWLRLAAPNIKKLRELIRQSKEDIQRAEEELRAIQSQIRSSQSLTMQRVNGYLSRSEETLQKIEEELRTLE